MYRSIKMKCSSLAKGLAESPGMPLLSKGCCEEVACSGSWFCSSPCTMLSVYKIRFILAFNL